MAALNSIHVFYLIVWVFLSPFTTAVTQQVLSSVVYSNHGERTPYIWTSLPELTPYGAQQMYSAGTIFRERYLAATFDAGRQSTIIRGISSFQIEDSELSILSSNDQWVAASAQAFMQGLYPPLGSFTGDTVISGLSTLANGTNVLAPLNGYQYPPLETVSSNDLNSIWIEGIQNCPAYTTSMLNYYNTSHFQTMYQQTLPFYRNLAPSYLDGVFSDNSIGYFSAYYIYDYLKYARNHNASMSQNLRDSEFTEAKILADDWVYTMYANTTDSGRVGDGLLRAMAGRTLASRVLSLFWSSINNQGRTNKLNLLFGGYEPMVSFAALAGLAVPQHAAFYSTPEDGSSLVFELVSLVADNATAAYPSTSSMFVKFYYQDGSANDSTLVQYPLFGRSPSQTLMSLTDFVAEMEDIMVKTIDDWCDTCESYSVFCPAFDQSLGSNGSSRRHGLHPAVAGVIGALVTLLVAGLIVVAVMVLGGFRLRRKDDTKRRSGLAGFKGAEKLASDLDLTIPKGGSGATVAVAAAAGPRGHERTGSWELREQTKREEAQLSGIDSSLATRPRRPSYEDDEIRVNPYGMPVKPHDHV